MLKNKCCLYVIISIRFFSITICNLLIEFPSCLQIIQKTMFKIKNNKYGDSEKFWEPARKNVPYKIFICIQNML